MQPAEEVVLKIKEGSDFYLRFEYEDKNNQPINFDYARLVARSRRSTSGNLWLDINKDEDSQLIFINNNAITIEIPAENLNFSGKGFYELYVETSGGEEGVLIEGPLLANDSIII